MCSRVQTHGLVRVSSCVWRPEANLGSGSSGIHLFLRCALLCPGALIRRDWPLSHRNLPAVSPALKSQAQTTVLDF